VGVGLGVVGLGATVAAAGETVGETPELMVTLHEQPISRMPARTSRPMTSRTTEIGAGYGSADR
jgi:hypothetical protein